MSLFSRVLDVTISTESKLQKNEAQLGPVVGEGLSGIAKPLAEAEFRRLLCQERKRSERSRKSFLLMLVRPKASTVSERKLAL